MSSLAENGRGIGCDPQLRAYLFPLSSSSNKTNDSFRNAGAMSDDGSMVNEFVCAEFQEKEGGDEGGDVESDDVGVGHGPFVIKKTARCLGKWMRDRARIIGFMCVFI